MSLTVRKDEVLIEGEPPLLRMNLLPRVKTEGEPEQRKKMAPLCHGRGMVMRLPPHSGMTVLD